MKFITVKSKVFYIIPRLEWLPWELEWCWLGYRGWVTINHKED